MIDYKPSFQQTLGALGARARQLRLLRGLGQAELAERAGVGVATIARFERTGSATIENVLRVATALSAESAFERLFEAPAYASLDEALARSPSEGPRRRRAPRRK